MKRVYKETPIGRIPKKWHIVKLGDSAITEIRGSRTIREFREVAFIPMEFVSDSGLFAEYEIRPMKDVRSFTYCEAGDLLLAKITPSFENGKQGIVPDNVPNGFALATTEVFPIICKDINRLFLFYILKSPKFRKILENSMIGTTGRQRVPKKVIENLQIPLPPLPEQQKIAEILFTVDNAIQKVDESITKTEKLKKGLMQELLTRGVILGFMLDTTVFNDILNNKIDTSKFPQNFNYFVTHIQLDELDETPDPHLREKLKRIFFNIDKEEIPTESFVFDISRFDKAKLGNGEIHDKLKKVNLRNTEDALIGETAIMNGLILVTDDKGLLRKVRELGGWAITLKDFSNGNYRKFKETEIGKTPEYWRVMKLGNALEMCQYGLSLKMSETGTYPILRMDEIANGYVVPRNVKYVDLDEKTFRNFKLEKGDILFNRTNSYELVGRTGIFLLDDDYVFASYLIRLRPKNEILDSHFLMFYLVFSNERLRRLATRAVHQANINAKNLQRIKIPVPKLTEQRKIVKILVALDRKLELERKRKGKLERIKKGLMNDLLTGKVRVRVS